MYIYITAARCVA